MTPSFSWLLLLTSIFLHAHALERSSVTYIGFSYQSCTSTSCSAWNASFSGSADKYGHSALYFGQHNVNNLGSCVGSLDAASFASLAQAVVDADFTELDPSYGSSANASSPRAVTSAVWAGPAPGTKSVVDFGESGPAALLRLESALQTVSRAVRWNCRFEPPFAEEETEGDSGTIVVVVLAVCAILALLGVAAVVVAIVVRRRRWRQQQRYHQLDTEHEDFVLNYE